MVQPFSRAYWWGKFDGNAPGVGVTGEGDGLGFSGMRARGAIFGVSGFNKTSSLTIFGFGAAVATVKMKTVNVSARSARITLEKGICISCSSHHHRDVGEHGGF